MAEASDRQNAMAQLRSRIGHVWEDVCNFIIRPDRAMYTLSDLGPPVFRISDSNSTLFQRVDLELENMRGMKIKCSWYQPLKAEDLPPMPCLVYLHGNCGSRYDGLEVLHVLRHGMSLFTYDACGSGMSDGEHVTLGFYERQDLAAVVDFLHGIKRVSAVGLWGRSMGAVTSIMYAAKDPSIACIVCDSPFSTMRRLAEDLVQEHGSWVPNFVVSAAVEKVRKRIAKKAHFDINDLDSLKYAAMCECPAFMYHGQDDDFVKPFHSVDVAEAYGGSCLHRIVEGSHNDSRGADVQRIAVPFLKLYLIDKPNAAAERKKQAEEERARLSEKQREVIEEEEEKTAAVNGGAEAPIPSPNGHSSPLPAARSTTNIQEDPRTEPDGATPTPSSPPPPQSAEEEVLNSEQASAYQRNLEDAVSAAAEEANQRLHDDAVVKSPLHSPEREINLSFDDDDDVSDEDVPHGGGGDDEEN